MNGGWILGDAGLSEEHATASAATIGSEQQLRDRPANAFPLADGLIALAISHVISARWKWLNLWKVTIEALDRLVGQIRAARNWHPIDAWINELGLQYVRALFPGTGVLVHLAAHSVGQAT